MFNDKLHVPKLTDRQTESLV